MSYTIARPEALITASLEQGHLFGEFPAHHQPTAQFVEALQKPQCVEVDGSMYSAYVLPSTHEASEAEPPLVACTSFSNATARYSTARMLNALASNTSRRIISIDQGVPEKSYHPSLLRCLGVSFESRSEAYAHVLEKIGLDGEVDLMGVCIGGVLAAHMAEKLGRQARSLTTFSCIGFESDGLRRLRQRMNNTGQEARSSKLADDLAKELTKRDDRPDEGYVRLDDLPEVRQSRLKWSLTYGKAGSGLSYGRPPMIELPDRLAPTTKWRDVMCGEDSMTNFATHQIVVAERERRHPGTSDCTLLEGVGHNWPLIRMPLTAALVEIELRTLDQVT